MTGAEVNGVIDKVATYLDGIAAKLGVGVGKIWPWLVKQQVLEGYTAVASAAGLVAITVATWVGFYILIVRGKVYRAERETYDSHERREMCYVAACVTLGILGVIGAVGSAAMVFGDMPSAIRHILNPEYYALADLMNMVK